MHCKHNTHQHQFESRQALDGNKSQDLGVHNHFTSLYTAKTLEETIHPYITNNIPHITTQQGYKINHFTNTA